VRAVAELAAPPTQLTAAERARLSEILGRRKR
jgi:hypothetical protein